VGVGVGVAVGVILFNSKLYPDILHKTGVGLGVAVGIGVGVGSQGESIKSTHP
jgi:hypothetical protein